MEDFTEQMEQCYIQIRAVLQAVLPAHGPELQLTVLLDVLAQVAAEVMREKNILEYDAFATELGLDLVERIRVHMVPIRPRHPDAP